MCNVGLGALLTVPDMSADMPETQRKRFAAKAVQDIMKDL